MLSEVAPASFFVSEEKRLGDEIAAFGNEFGDAAIGDEEDGDEEYEQSEN